MSRDGFNVDPYAGGLVARDIAVSPAGSAMGFSVPQGVIIDTNAGQFFGIDIGDTGLATPVGGASGIVTWAFYPNGQNIDARQSQTPFGNGDGMVFTALTYASRPDLDPNRAVMFGVGSRGGSGVFNETPLNPRPIARNVLYRLDPDTGEGINWLGLPTRSDADYENGIYSMAATAGTNVQEAGYFSLATGTINGVTTIGPQIFGVSSSGELVTPTVVGGGLPASRVVINDPTSGQPINFTGLTRGPANVEAGRFANMLFGVSTTGRMYAFNTAGVLQPIFPQ
jgi:hypothetical protein